MVENDFNPEPGGIFSGSLDCAVACGSITFSYVVFFLVAKPNGGIKPQRRRTVKNPLIECQPALWLVDSEPISLFQL